MIAGIIQNGNIDLKVVEAEWSREIADRVRYAMLCRKTWTFLDIVTMGEREFPACRHSRRRKGVRTWRATTTTSMLDRKNPSSGGVQ